MSEVIDEPEQATSTELVDLPPKETALVVYSTVGGLDPFIQQIRDKVIGTVYDMATVKGRHECASDAFKVAKSKAAIEKLGKALSAEYKEIPKKIDAERKRAFTALEALQEEVRRPLTEWEEAEETRVARHKAGIEMMQNAAGTHDFSSSTIRTTIASIESIVVDESWEEFEAEAHRVKAKTLETLAAALVAREKHEAEQTELVRLRAEAETRRIQDEKDRIAREAAEAATRAAEVKAQAERDAAAKREADAKAAQKKAEQDKQEAIERQKQAEARAEAEKLAAEERARQAAEEARKAEIQRQKDDAARVAAEIKKREADKAHKAKVNNAAMAALVAGGLTPESAKLAITLIAKKQIPAISINY